MKPALNALQVASLLVSASYGIGFLFGSGELALEHGMAGSIYGLATAVGMLLLALLASRLWTKGMPIWDLFGQAYGRTMRNGIAVLSIVWMSGVLAAQIHGGVAVMQLLGLDHWAAFAIVLLGVLIASQLNLQIASKVFSVLLLGSGVLLVYMLVSSSNGGSIYAHAPAQFMHDLGTFRPMSIVSIAIAVVALVCTGSDYHQYLLAAKRPTDAVLGCLLAGAVLLALSFVPASVVLALNQDGVLSNLQDSKQAIPYALVQTTKSWGGYVLSSVCLLGLLGSALGSGAAILRAMSAALLASNGWAAKRGRTLADVLVLAFGALLASRGTGIVSTMVSVNVIYIASVSGVLAFMIMRRPLPAKLAWCAVAAGFVASTAVYLTAWDKLAGGEEDLAALGLGVGASGLALLFSALMRSRQPKCRLSTAVNFQMSGGPERLQGRSDAAN